MFSSCGVVKSATAWGLAFSAAALCACGNSGVENPGSPNSPQRWVSAWGTANYTSFPNGPLTQPGFSPSTGAFTGNEAVEQSFRMMIHPALGGDRVRFKFSNVYGDRPLVIRSVSVAQRLSLSGAAVVADRVVPITFAGGNEVTIPPGAERLSDGGDFSYEFGDDLAVSFHIPGPSGPMSWHAEAFATQYISPPNSGDVTADASGASFSSVDRGWFFLAGMDVQAGGAGAPFAIVAFGDSITDGFASTPERNERYPDFLARRIQAAGIPAGLVNTGINSNTVGEPLDAVTQGVAGIARFPRDVLERSEVRSVFILLGTNDITAGRSADEIYAGLANIASQAHAAGVCTLVSTILPRNDLPVPFGWDAAVHEPVRESLNELILGITVFDAVADVGKAMEDPLLPNQPFRPYFVEGLHPNSVGMEVLANAIPLEPLLPAPLGSCARQRTG